MPLLWHTRQIAAAGRVRCCPVNFSMPGRESGTIGLDANCWIEWGGAWILGIQVVTLWFKVVDLRE